MTHQASHQLAHLLISDQELIGHWSPVVSALLVYVVLPSRELPGCTCSAALQLVGETLHREQVATTKQLSVLANGSNGFIRGVI